jgi:hypothetical protein
MPGGWITVLRGLYYSVAGTASFAALVDIGGWWNEYDLVRPTEDHPIVDTSVPGVYGLLGFSTGLYGIEYIGDSGLVSESENAWKVKIPWETHLRRNVPDEEVYANEDSILDDIAEQRYERALTMIEGWGDDVDNLPSDLSSDLEDWRPAELPRTVDFEIRGEWWDLHLEGNTNVSSFPESAERVDRPFGFTFHGDEQFGEVTITQMEDENNTNQGALRLSDSLSRLKDSSISIDPFQPEERPVYFDTIERDDLRDYNWELSFRNIHLYPLSPTSMLDLRMWFDYEDPFSVRLDLTEDPKPLYQQLRYEWL